MKVLIACEESQIECIEFRKLGHESYSCDILPCSGGHPEWHIKSDVLPLLNGRCLFTTCDGVQHVITTRWDLIIAHPPCTYLSNAGNAHLNQPGRSEKRSIAADFFMRFVNADCMRIAIENPPGYMNTFYRPADQTIHPYFFGDPELKRTCLWLKGLPLLYYTNLLDKPSPIYTTFRDGKIKNRYRTEALSSAFLRSKSFPGIAAAMAAQWTEPNLYSLFEV